MRNELKQLRNELKSASNNETTNKETRPSSPSPSLTSLELPPHASAAPSLRVSEPVMQPEPSASSSSSSSASSSASSASSAISEETLARIKRMEELLKSYKR